MKKELSISYGMKVFPLILPHKSPWLKFLSAFVVVLRVAYGRGTCFFRPQLFW